MNSSMQKKTKKNILTYFDIFSICYFVFLFSNYYILNYYYIPAIAEPYMKPTFSYWNILGTNKEGHYVFVIIILSLFNSLKFSIPIAFWAIVLAHLYVIVAYYIKSVEKTLDYICSVSEEMIPGWTIGIRIISTFFKERSMLINFSIFFSLKAYIILKREILEIIHSERVKNSIELKVKKIYILIYDICLMNLSNILYLFTTLIYWSTKVESSSFIFFDRNLLKNTIFSTSNILKSLLYHKDYIKYNFVIFMTYSSIILFFVSLQQLNKLIKKTFIFNN